MFIPWHDKSIRLTGRWSRLGLNGEPGEQPAHSAVTTAPGSYFEIAFSGSEIVLQFDLGYLAQPYPHLWLCLDNGSRFEAPVDRFLRIHAENPGVHVLRATFKSAMEMMHRWYAPQLGCIAFVGAQVERPEELPRDDRPIIEFIGDSITEGVLIDVESADSTSGPIDQFNRPYQDDNLATYAALTAQELNLRPIFQAYGAVGMTRSGCGSVPRAGLIYPYVYDETPYTGETPDIIVINHGTNDRGRSADEFLCRYEEYLNMVRELRPDAKVVCLTPFCGAFDSELRGFIPSYNKKYQANVYLISSLNWIPSTPIHPLRDGHRIVAEHLAPLLAEIIAE